MASTTTKVSPNLQIIVTALPSRFLGWTALVAEAACDPVMPGSLSDSPWCLQRANRLKLHCEIYF
jgi:hypothetical protein